MSSAGFGFGDYAPVGINDDEEERLKRGGYAPVQPSAPPVSTTPPVSAPSGTADLESHVSAPHAYAPVTPEQARPQWKDYAPAEPHGWGKVGHFVAALNPQTDQYFNKRPQQEAEEKYKNAVAEYGAPQAERKTEAEIGQKTAQGELEHAQAEQVGSPKPTEETWKAVPGMIGKNGEVLQESSKGTLRWAPGIAGAGPVKEPAENEKEKDISDYIAAHNLEDTPANREGARKAIAERGKQEPGSFMPLYDDKGHVTGAWDPKSGRIVKPPAEGLPGTTGQGSTIANRGITSQMRNVAAQASLVHSEMPSVISEIQSMKDELGPVEGRWNDFMQGKIGMDNPKFAGLRTDLLMMSSAVALMHARGRLPENLREEFDRAINSPKQSAENLVTTLQHIDKWTADNMNAMGQGGATTNAPATGGAIEYKPGLIRNGYEFQGGDPTKKESWKQVTKQAQP